MSYLNVASGAVVAELPGEARAQFIRKTYMHVAVAVGAFALLEAFLLSIGMGEKAASLFMSVPYSNIVMLVGFIGVSWLANNWAHSGASRELQYAGLALYVVAFALFMLPIMYIASAYFPGVIEKAAWVTGAFVLSLTAVVFTTKKDFSFLAPAIMVGCIVGLTIFVLSAVFGFNLGTFFFGAMVLYAGGCILFTTSSVMHHYHEEQYVAGSLALFSSIGMSFLYILQFFMSFSGE